MIPAGYMAKHIAGRPEWLKAEHVADVYSVSNCMSGAFADYIKYWKHNGFWLFDSPYIIQKVARDHSIDLADTRLFYYEVHELEFEEDGNSWKPFAPEPSFTTQVFGPESKILEGYNVVTFYGRASPECSPLSCNALASELGTNRHCLLSSFERAKTMLEQGRFRNTEPGPYRIFAVYSVKWPLPALQEEPGKQER